MGRAICCGCGSRPITVERGKIVLAVLGYGGPPLQGFLTLLHDGREPTRAGNMRWRCAIVSSAVGMIRAATRAALGRRFGGHELPMLPGLLMIVIAAVMVTRRWPSGGSFVSLSFASAPQILQRLAG